MKIMQLNKYNKYKHHFIKIYRNIKNLEEENFDNHSDKIYDSIKDFINLSQKNSIDSVFAEAMNHFKEMHDDAFGSWKKTLSKVLNFLSILQVKLKARVGVPSAEMSIEVDISKTIKELREFITKNKAKFELLNIKIEDIEEKRSEKYGNIKIKNGIKITNQSYNYYFGLYSVIKEEKNSEISVSEFDGLMIEYSELLDIPSSNNDLWFNHNVLYLNQLSSKDLNVRNLYKFIEIATLVKEEKRVDKQTFLTYSENHLLLEFHRKSSHIGQQTFLFNLLLMDHLFVIKDSSFTTKEHFKNLLLMSLWNKRFTSFNNRYYIRFNQFRDNELSIDIRRNYRVIELKSDSVIYELESGEKKILSICELEQMKY